MEEKLNPTLPFPPPPPPPPPTRVGGAADMSQLRSVQFGSDLRFLDQTMSRLRGDLDKLGSKLYKESNMGGGAEEGVRPIWWWWEGGCCCGCGCGGGGWFKKAEIESAAAARESYSSLPPLDDCKLPLLLPESMETSTHLRISHVCCLKSSDLHKT